MAKLRARPLRFLERVVVTPRARHTPEKTDRRVELCRFSRFAELIPRRRIGLSRFSPFVSKSWQNDAPGRSFVYMHKCSLRSSSPSFPSLSLRRPGPGPAWPRWARPDRTARRRAGGPGRAGPGRAAPGSYRRPAGLRNATGGKASAHTTGPGFGMRPASGLRNATRLRRTRPDQVSARRLLNWSPVDGSDFVVVFLDFSNYHPVKVPNASSPHLASGSLLLPPFTHRSARRGTGLCWNRFKQKFSFPQLIPRRRIGLCRRFPRFLQLSPC